MKRKALESATLLGLVMACAWSISSAAAPQRLNSRSAIDSNLFHIACGDGEVDPAEKETCDPPNAPAGGNGNICRGDCTVCGDGIQQENRGEDCDDGNGVDNDACGNDCHPNQCGDGDVDDEDGETCDPPGGPAGGNGNECRDTCTSCGDGVVQESSGEECDDGNGIDGDACSNDCRTQTTELCGNGNVDEEDGETCDPPNSPAGENGHLCRGDCTVCGDGVPQENRGEDCDDGNGIDTDGCTNDCHLGETGPCSLTVTKTCEVPRPQSAGSDCRGKVVSLKLEYTGAGCGGTTNAQSGKATCTGGANGADPVNIVVSNTKGGSVFANVTGIGVGDVFEVRAANAGKSQLDADTLVRISSGLEVVKFHTSCSKPLNAGDQFGSLRVVEMTTTEGGTVGVGNGNGEPSNECVVTNAPPAPNCVGKVRAMHLQYLGGACTPMNNPQSGKFICTGNAASTDPVRIVSTDDGRVLLDTGSPADVHVGDVVDLLASNAGRSELRAQTLIKVFNGSGTEIQSLSIHTSCSQPLNVGDRFGSLKLFGLETTEGGNVAQAGNVQYNYAIHNGGSETIFNLTVTDDVLGVVPGSPIGSLDPGETRTLHASALVDSDVTNTVTVTGSLEEGDTCGPATATATVTVDDTPAPHACTAKIKAMRLRYTGPTIGSSVTVRFAGDKFSDSGAVYNFPGGLTNGAVLTLASENGWTVDSAAHGKTELGAKTYIYVNGVLETIHTSCSTPFRTGAPAPLDNPKGNPSPNWFVEDFTP